MRSVSPFLEMIFRRNVYRFFLYNIVARAYIIEEGRYRRQRLIDIQAAAAHGHTGGKRVLRTERRKKGSRYQNIKTGGAFLRRL